MIFEYRDPYNSILRVEKGTLLTGAPMVCLTSTGPGKAVVEVPIDHVEEVVAGIRDAARQTGQQPAHCCGNCDGIDPDTCLNNPGRAGQQPDETAEETHVVTDDSDDPEHIDDCPGCETGIDHTEHCFTPETHNWGCGSPTDERPAAEQQDVCRTTDVDGATVLVRGSGDWTDEDRAHAAELARAARHRFEAEPRCPACKHLWTNHQQGACVIRVRAQGAATTCGCTETEPAPAAGPDFTQPTGWAHTCPDGEPCPQHDESAEQSTGETPDRLAHIGWWCWRGNDHGHLVDTACRSDNVPIHVPTEWAAEMRAVIEHLTDTHELGEDCTWVTPEEQAAETAAAADEDPAS